MPFFLAFALALNTIVQLSIVELSLKTTVMESTKQMAAYMYPVELLYTEAMKSETGSKLGAVWRGIVDKVGEARDKLIQAEEWVDDYAAFLPESIVKWMQWEQTFREQGEQLGQDAYRQYYNETLAPLIYDAFKPIVLRHADNHIIRPEQFRITDMTFPTLGNPSKAYFGIEAEVAFKLPIPFINKTVYLRKRAYERIWTGA
ncbi:hypothetical protein J2TS4_18910 [Paenibacillus sp. J2TS4]|nr:hypothetical protein J2TS4_18910 [Paenibacillus sp. J2TS4]